METIAALIGVVVALGLAIWIAIVLPFSMAERRGRNGWIWILISVVGSPLLAILLLIALGNTPENTR